MSKVVFATLAVAAAGMSQEVKDAFDRFSVEHGKNYSADEIEFRRTVFADNLARVSKQNDEHILAGGEAVFGITKFMDLTPEEFKAQYLTYRQKAPAANVVTPSKAGMAADVDWRTQGAVTKVKDQGQCGSCWAFSATEAIESYSFLNGDKLQELSPQQINSCDKTDGGCNGGNTETAYRYVESAGGITTEAEYPYTSGSGRTGTCEISGKTMAVKINGFTSVRSGEDNLQAALNDGPVSVCLAAEAFQTYNSGILKTCRGQVDHCVQAVGYDSGNNYWIVRNSWGTGWGESGFIRIEMGKDLCKISDDVTFPTF